MVQDVVEHLLEKIKDSLGNGETIELRGFGTFEPRLRKAKSSARNPKTGETIKIKASKVPGFKAAKALKEAVK